MDSSDQGVFRLALLLPPPHKHHDDHAKDERAQRIEYGYVIVAASDVDDHSDKRSDSVDAPRFDGFGRSTGLPVSYAFNRGEIGDRHDHQESHEANPRSLRDPMVMQEITRHSCSFLVKRIFPPELRRPEAHPEERKPLDRQQCRRSIDRSLVVGLRYRPSSHSESCDEYISCQ